MFFQLVKVLGQFDATALAPSSSMYLLPDHDEFSAGGFPDFMPGVHRLFQIGGNNTFLNGYAKSFQDFLSLVLVKIHLFDCLNAFMLEKMFSRFREV